MSISKFPLIVLITIVLLQGVQLLLSLGLLLASQLRMTDALLAL